MPELESQAEQNQAESNASCTTGCCPPADGPRMETVRRVDPKVGRNDPCPCQSGRKFKKCCGR